MRIKGTPAWWWNRLLRRVRAHVTLAGLLYSGALTVVCTVALLSGNNLLFLVLAAMLSLLMLSGFLSRLSLAGLEMDFVTPEHITAGRPVDATLAVRNLKIWMPSFSLRVEGAPANGAEAPDILRTSVYIPLIPGGATIEDSVEIQFARRGSYRQHGFYISTRFPFGFREKTAEVSLAREVLVYPSIEPQPGFEQLTAAVTGEIEGMHRGSGQDFYHIRPYQASESARYVDWKTSAHTGELQVREFAREEDRQVEIYFDRNIDPRDDAQCAWFEHTVDFCAFLSWRLAQRGVTFHFRTQGYSRRVPGESDVYTILKFLALVTAVSHGPLDPPHDESSLQIVISQTPTAAEALGWTPAIVLDGRSGLLAADVATPAAGTSQG